MQNETNSHPGRDPNGIREVRRASAGAVSDRARAAQSLLRRRLAGAKRIKAVLKPLLPCYPEGLCPDRFQPRSVITRSGHRASGRSPRPAGRRAREEAWLRGP